MTAEVGGTADRGAKIRALTLAAAAAIVLALLAPEDWSSGPATLEVNYRGRLAISSPIELGAADPFSASGEVGDARIGAVADEGFELDGPIGVDTTVDDPGHDPVLGDVEVTIITADGNREIVPVFDENLDVFQASRRPVESSAIVLAVLGAAIVLWVSEAIPLFVTSLAIPVALAGAEVGTAREALSPFFDPIIVLFFGGFLMAEAMRRADLDRLVAITIVDLAGRGAVRLYVALIALAAFMSMWMSNTAAVTVLLPIAMAVTEPLDSLGYRKAVVLGIAYAATIGGVGSAIGTPANPLAITFIERLTGREISFAEWFAFGLPMVVAFLPVMAVYLWRVSGVKPPADKFRHARSVAQEERRSAGPLSREQIHVLAVFGGVVGLWLTSNWHGTSTGIVALGGAVALFVVGRIEPDDVNRINWPTLLTFGGGLALGTFMVSTGTSDWLVTQLGGLGGWPKILAIAIVAFVALGVTTVASNTAAAATLIPLAVPLAGIVGVEPVLLVVVVAIASSVDFALVIGTPPTMLAYSTHLFTTREILKKGTALDIVGIAVLVLVVVPIWQLLDLV